MSDTIVQAILVWIAFSFAIFLAYWVRRIEYYNREPWTQVLFAFVIGAVITVIGSAGLTLLLLMPLQGFGDCLPFDLTAGGILAAVVIAPFAEELMKAAGVLALAGWIREVEDGVIYGAAVGLGFAATENVLYYTEALVTLGTGGLIATVVVRSFTSTLLHLGATGLSGFGLGIHYAGIDKKRSWWLFIVAAMFIHGIFNLSANLQLLSSDVVGRLILAVAGLFFGVLLTWSLFFWLRQLIQRFDRPPNAEFAQ